MMVSSRDYRLTIFIEECVIFVVLEFVYLCTPMYTLQNFVCIVCSS